jgi:CHAT domain-containing protein/tetratricopeptide (TPR) repeat protein
VVWTVTEEGQAHRAGLRVGDEVGCWSAEGSAIADAVHFVRIEHEHGPRGPMTVHGSRAGTPQAWTIAPGRWGLKVRPAFAPRDLARFESVKVDDAAGAEQAWAPLAADLLARGASRDAAWLRLQLGESLAAAREWDAAHRALDDAAAGVAGDPAALGWIARQRAELHRRQGDPARRGEALRAALEHERAIDGGGLVASYLISRLGAVAWMQGRLEDAEALLLEGLETRRRLAPDSLDVAESVNDLGNLAWARGDLRAALAHYEEALRIRERLVPGSVDVAAVIENIALVAEWRGDLDRAEDAYLRAGALIAARGEPDAERRAKNLVGLANVALARGDLDGADAKLEEAHRLVTTRGSRDRLLATILSNRGEVAFRRKELAEAESLHRAALALREDLGIPLDARWSRARLGAVALARSDLEQAQSLLGEALEEERRDAPRGLRVARLLLKLAQVAMKDRAPARAESLFAEAVDILESEEGAGSVEYAEGLVGLAEARAAAGEVADAIDAALSAESASREQLRAVVRHLSEREALAFAASRPSGLAVALRLLAAGAAPASARAFDVVDSAIRSRALVLDEMASRNRFAGEGDLAPLIRDVIRSRERLARLAVRGRGEQAKDSYRRVLDEARQEKEQAERALARAGAPFREEVGAGDDGLARVYDALGPDDALVGYVLYAHPGSYVAFVVRPGAPPRVFDLGAAAGVDALVSAWKAALLFEAEAPGRAQRRSRDRYVQAGAALRRKVWDPLASRLRGANRVYVVPDGILHLVSFASLPASGGGYLVEAGPLIHVLSAERDLLTPRDSPGEGLLVVGDPDFESAPVAVAGPPSARAAAPAFRGARPGCEALVRQRFASLAAAADETDSVAAQWRSARGGGDLMVLRRRAASEAAFKEGAAGRRIVHLVTHGFFVGEDCPSALDPALPPGVGENPLLRAGLALAGANHRDAAAAGQDDGILTAEEAAALDLRGVEWAVLSACDTGLGDVRAGEGVFGLQRAFRVAGAHNVIMSLWPVEDGSGRDFMRALYRNRLGRGLPTSQAARRAALEVLRGRRARGASDHPFYWAPFVAAGPDAR